MFEQNCIELCWWKRRCHETSLVLTAPPCSLSSWLHAPCLELSCDLRFQVQRCTLLKTFQPRLFAPCLVWFYFGELRSQHFPSLDLEILQSRKSHRHVDCWHCMFPFKGMLPKCCARHLSKMSKFNAKDWQEWSECSASCGPGGRRKRIRSGGSTQRKCIANRKLNRGGWKD